MATILNTPFTQCQHATFNRSLFAHRNIQKMETDIDRLFFIAKKNTHVKTWADLARLLNVSDQVLTNWKGRGIPKDKLMDIAEIVKADPYWIRSGGHAPNLYPTQAIAHVAEVMQAMEPQQQHLIARLADQVVESEKTANVSDQSNGTRIGRQ